MLRTVTYILVLGVLGFGVWFFLFKDKDLFTVDEAGFQVKNTDIIDKIYLVDKKGKSIQLKRDGSEWSLNDSFKALSGMVNTLLYTLEHQEAAYPVPEQSHNSVIKVLSGTSTKVELYDADNKSIRKFYVGGQASNNMGTYMLIEGADRPYVVQIPVFKGYLTSRYSTELLDWRNRTLVSVPQENLKSVTVNYTSEDTKLNSFTVIKNKSGKIDVSLPAELTINKELNKERVEDYTTFFEKLNCEGYLVGVTDMDSTIATTEKRCNILITTTDGKQQSLDIYWMPINKRSKNLTTHDPETPDIYDSDRFYAVTNNYRDTAIIQRHTFDKVFRKGFEFYEAEPAQ